MNFAGSGSDDGQSSPRAPTDLASTAPIAASAELAEGDLASAETSGSDALQAETAAATEELSAFQLQRHHSADSVASGSAAGDGDGNGGRGGALFADQVGAQWPSLHVATSVIWLHLNLRTGRGCCFTRAGSPMLAG